ncbi:FABL116Cp [Eremothecium gossypii FDAG1]|nr:FABL116Cp [Eremothecium gossypii FDAG1]
MGAQDLDKQSSNSAVAEIYYESNKYGHKGDLIECSNKGPMNYIDAKNVHDDVELLAEIGYKQELKRHFSTLQIFGIAFSIMGLLPSIASVLPVALPGGSVSMVWGWFIFGAFILAVGAAMAELASAIPTSGGLYYYTYYYAPPRLKACLSFLIGNGNSLALIAGLCSIEYGLAEQILSIIAISSNSYLVSSRWLLYGIYCMGLLATVLLASIATFSVSLLQTASIVMNLALVALFIIVLPVGVAHNGRSFNSAKFMFTNFENHTGWPDWFQFFLCGSLPIVWVIGAFDSTVHMSEEAKNATRSVPIGILSSISTCWALGFAIVVVIAACMGPDIDAILNGEFNHPLAQILYNALGKGWALSVMVFIVVCQYLMGASILTASSRQIWAFARDDGLPFSSWIKVVNTKLSSPLRATWASAFVALVIGLLTLAGPTASSALFSMAVAANYLAWMTPNLLRMLFGKEIYRPGSFYMGKFWSPVINWTAILFQVFIILVMMFPSDTAGLRASTMNYTAIITGFVWIGSIFYFLAYKHRTFIGPKSNLGR